MESQSNSGSPVKASSKSPPPPGEDEFVTSAALEAEIKSFCFAHSLTPRECEILASLVEGVVRIKDIAVRMSLSPNTVNNHVNSIFVKTKARSKSQLLSHLLTYAAEELQAARALRRRVRVAVVDADSAMAHQLVSDLMKRGFEAQTFETTFPMSQWPRGLADYKPEFIAVDHVSISSSAHPELIENAKGFASQVVVCGQSENPVARRNAMAAGAIEWFAKPCDGDRLTALLTAHAVPVSDPTSVTTRAILFEKKALPFKVARTPISVKKEQAGAGGVFITNEELMAAIGPVQAGDWLEFDLNLESRPAPVPARGQVVWRAAEGECPGAGVRLSYLDFETQSWLMSVMREQKSRAYIPAGL